MLTTNVSLVDASSTKEDAIRQTYYPGDFSQFVPRSALDWSSKYRVLILTKVATIEVLVRPTPTYSSMDGEYPESPMALRRR